MFFQQIAACHTDFWDKVLLREAWLQQGWFVILNSRSLREVSKMRLPQVFLTWWSAATGTIDSNCKSPSLLTIRHIDLKALDAAKVQEHHVTAACLGLTNVGINYLDLEGISGELTSRMKVEKKNTCAVAAGLQLLQDQAIFPCSQCMQKSLTKLHQLNPS